MGHRRYRDTAIALALLCGVALLAGCGGKAANKEPVTEGSAAASSGQTPSSVTQAAQPAMPAQPIAKQPNQLELNSVQLVVTNSKSNHLPNSVYTTRFVANQSKGMGISFFGSPLELVHTHSLAVRLGSLRLLKDGGARQHEVGSILVQFGSPPSGNSQMINSEAIEVTYTYDAASNTFRGSFKGTFADGVMYNRLDMERTATIEGSFYVENPN